MVTINSQLYSNMSDPKLFDNSVGSEYILADPLFGSDPALYPLFIDVNNMPPSADLPVGIYQCMYWFINLFAIF